MSSIYLVGENDQAQVDIERKETPLDLVTMVTNVDPDDQDVNMGKYLMFCSMVHVPQGWNLEPDGLRNAWRGVFDGILQNESKAIGGELRHSIPPIEVATALTSLILAQTPSVEENQLIELSRNPADQKLELGSLLAFRLLATLKLIKETNPQMYELLIPSLHTFGESNHIGIPSPDQLQSQYTHEVSKVIAFIMLEQFKLMYPGDLDTFNEVTLLRALSPELSRFSSHIYPAKNVKKMWNNFCAVLMSDENINKFLGAAENDLESNVNPDLLRLLTYIGSTVQLYIHEFVDYKYARTEEFRMLRNKFMPRKVNSKK